MSTPDPAGVSLRDRFVGCLLGCAVGDARGRLTRDCIVGALAGVRLGVGAIPEHLRRTVRQSRKPEDLALRYHERVTRPTR